MASLPDDMRRLINEQFGHPLPAWLHCFDRTHECKIDIDDFIEGCDDLGWEGSAEELFNKLDVNGSGVLTLDEFDTFSATIWLAFRRWCGQTFTSAQDMVERLTHKGRRDNTNYLVASFSPEGGERAARSAARRIAVFRSKGNLSGFTMGHLVESAVRLGWYAGHEQLLFRAMDTSGSGVVQNVELLWFERERIVLKKLMEAQSRMPRTGQRYRKSKALSIRSLQSFTTFLKQVFNGSIFRAWRATLDMEGHMHVPRKVLTKACLYLGWYGDTVALWTAVDSDDSGFATFEELAPVEARLLALFKQWLASTMGGTQKSLFRKLLMGARSVRGVAPDDHKGRLDKDSFLAACEKLEFPHEAEPVFDLLDWEGEGYVDFKDLRIIEKWEYPQWLGAEPNYLVAYEFKQALFQKYGHVLKAWRVGLDTDGSGKVTYQEFSHCAGRLGFVKVSEVAGAWVALDERCHGFITLRQINVGVYNTINHFRRWCHNTWGCVTLGFEAMDADGSGALTMKEFKKAIKNYDFNGDVSVVFHVFCPGNRGEISKDDIAFLDEWEVDVSLVRDLHEEEEEDEWESAEYELKKNAGGSARNKKKKPVQNVRPPTPPKRGLPSKWIPCRPRRSEEGGEEADGVDSEAVKRRTSRMLTAVQRTVQFGSCDTPAGSPRLTWAPGAPNEQRPQSPLEEGDAYKASKSVSINMPELTSRGEHQRPRSAHRALALPPQPEVMLSDGSSWTRVFERRAGSPSSRQQSPSRASANERQLLDFVGWDTPARSLAVSKAAAAASLELAAVALEAGAGVPASTTAGRRSATPTSSRCKSPYSAVHRATSDSSCHRRPA